MTINMSDQHRLAIPSLKHDLKIVIESNNYFIQALLRNESIWKIDQTTFDSFFPPSPCLSVIKRQLHYQNHRWGIWGPVDFSQLSTEFETLWCFCTFCSKACLQVSRFHNTSGCLSKPSEISVLIRVVFKGKIRAWQILLHPPATHFTADLQCVLCCSYKKVTSFSW